MRSNTRRYIPSRYKRSALGRISRVVVSPEVYSPVADKEVDIPVISMKMDTKVVEMKEGTIEELINEKKAENAPIVVDEEPVEQEESIEPKAEIDNSDTEIVVTKKESTKKESAYAKRKKARQENKKEE